MRQTLFSADPGISNADTAQFDAIHGTPTKSFEADKIDLDTT